jgi:hypothetical protein
MRIADWAYAVVKKEDLESFESGPESILSKY